MVKLHKPTTNVSYLHKSYFSYGTFETRQKINERYWVLL